MRRFALLVVAVLLGAGVGVGALPATGATTSLRAGPLARGEASPSPGTLTASAVGFAEQVLTEAPVPSGSEPSSSLPPVLDQAMERPGFPGLIDLHRIYSSPASPEAVEADVLGRLPRGAKTTGTATFGGPSGSGRGFAVSLPTSGPNEYLAQLVYSMVAHGSGSVVRVDAQSVWEPNRTETETIAGGAVAELTGFAALSLARPSSGPVTVRLDKSESAPLVGALNALAVAPKPDCMEEATLYTVVLHANGNARYEVTGEQCASTVEISLNGRQLAPLYDGDCSVVRLVSSYLPRRATGTRLAASQCRSGA